VQDGYNDDGWLIGRTQWDAPDVDPIVFLTDSEQQGVPPLEAGQMRRCKITSNSLFDLEAVPVA
jgi:ribosomal protein S12 methylthiotransferase